MEEFSLLASTQPNSVNDNIASSFRRTACSHPFMQEEVIHSFIHHSFNPIPKNHYRRFIHSTNLEDPFVFHSFILTTQFYETSSSFAIHSIPFHSVPSWHVPTLLFIHEWNGKFRDDVRNFIKGSDGFVGTIHSSFVFIHSFTFHSSPHHRKTSSILSFVTMDSFIYTFGFLQRKEHSFSTEKTTTTEKITTFHGTAPVVRKWTDRFE